MTDARSWRPKTIPVQHVRFGEARFWPRVTTSHVEGDCWLWTGQRTRRLGYGRFSIKHRMLPAHRVAWIATRGVPIPAHLLVLHTCDVPACVRPEHLYPGTPKDNARDCLNRNRFFRGARRANGRFHSRAAEHEATPEHWDGYGDDDDWGSCEDPAGAKKLATLRSALAAVQS